MWGNTHMQLIHDAPFTGMKWSGLGSEMGLRSIYAYTDPQTVFHTRSQVIKKGAGEAPTPGSDAAICRHLLKRPASPSGDAGCFR